MIKQKRKDIGLSNGITLIYLVIVTVILILIAGISLAILFGSNGIVEKARWADYVTEFEDVNERKEIYLTSNIVGKFQDNQIPSVDYLYTDNNLNETYYPVKNQVNTYNIPETLKNCIKEIEFLEENDFYNTNRVNLYEIDLPLIGSVAKHTYVVNIASGIIYNVEPVKFNNKLYHNPRTQGSLSTKLTEVGKYEMIVDVGEGYVARWDSINIFYDKKVENSVILKTYTSEDGAEWTEQNVEIFDSQENKDTYNINSDSITRFLKVEIEILDIDGYHSEIDYSLVNFYKFNDAQIEPEVLKDDEVQKVGKIYMLPETASDASTVTQTINLPNDKNEYAINIEEFGNPATTVKVVTPTETIYYTVEELRKAILPANSTITITTVLSPGDIVEEAKVFVKDNNLTTRRLDTTDAIASSSSSSGTSSTWKTVKKVKYMYNNGGSGYWQQCYIDSQEVNEYGILEISDNKRIQVKYQTSSDGLKWSREFSNIADADNIHFLKVNVYYQTLDNATFDNTNNSIYVKLAGGSLKFSFYNDKGVKLDSKRVYFTTDQSEVVFTMPTIQKDGYLLIAWISEGNTYMPGTSYTLRKDMDFTASYINQNLSSDNDFTIFAAALRSGNTFDKQTINLNYDIDLEAFGQDSWEPLGTTSIPFKGTFNGNNHFIRNINITNGSYKGLFSSISGATIKDLTLEGTISAQDYCGLLASTSSSSTINNVYTTVNSSVSGSYMLGGLIGQASSTTFTECGNSATVSGYKNIGGIAGNEGTYTKCYNTANISASTGYAGGIVGTNGNVTYSYNTGNVSGYGNDGTGYTSVGGIAGAGTTARYCYNTGTIYGSMGQVAGMVGNIYNMGGTPISYCYNIGPCTGSGRAIGSLGGECLNSNIDNCVYTTSNSVNGYRGSNTNCSHLSDEQMKAFTNQYFFADTNNINNGYPILEWQR